MVDDTQFPAICECLIDAWRRSTHSPLLTRRSPLFGAADRKNWVRSSAELFVNSPQVVIQQWLAPKPIGFVRQLFLDYQILPLASLTTGHWPRPVATRVTLWTCFVQLPLPGLPPFHSHSAQSERPDPECVELVRATACTMAIPAFTVSPSRLRNWLRFASTIPNKSTLSSW